MGNSNNLINIERLIISRVEHFLKTTDQKKKKVEIKRKEM